VSSFLDLYQLCLSIFPYNHKAVGAKNESVSMGKKNFFSLVLDFSGQAARFGVREDDKLVTINGKTPRNVDDAVGVIKQAGNSIKLVI